MDSIKDGEPKQTKNNGRNRENYKKAPFPQKLPIQMVFKVNSNVQVADESDTI